MRIFGTTKNNKMLVGMLNMSREENGFFQEVNKESIPNNIRESLESALGGCGSRTILDKRYFLSNTAGETAGKFFIKVAERIKFIPKNHDLLEELNNESDFLQGVRIITEALGREDLKFNFDFSFWDWHEKEEDNHVKCTLKLILNRNDYLPLKHPFEEDTDFEEYKEFFFGRDNAIITFSFTFPCGYKITEHEGIEKLEKLFANKDYTVQDIENLLKDSKDHKWYFSMDENRCFYGND